MRKEDFASKRAIPAKIQRRALANARKKKAPRRRTKITLQGEIYEGIEPIALPPKAANIVNDHERELAGLIGNRVVKTSNGEPDAGGWRGFRLQVSGGGKIEKKEQDALYQGFSGLADDLTAAHFPAKPFRGITPNGWQVGLRFRSYESEVVFG